ncbi:MAG: hypothetical protein ACU0CO_11990 [Shimia sp.]
MYAPAMFAVLHAAILKFGVPGLAAFWALKAGATWAALRWWRARRAARVNAGPQTPGG